MLSHVKARPLAGRILSVALLGAALLALGARPALATTKPTVILVHGAFADASGWNAEITTLEKAGYPVLAPPNPLRSVAGDGAYLDSILATINGPVVLVGHSYGGSVITDAATSAPNVKALVYIAAFAPDTGESALDLVAKNPGSLLGPKTLVSRPFANPDGTQGVDQYIKTSDFRNVFAQDLRAPLVAQMAATQRPMTLAALTDKLAVAPAWKTIPSWYMVASGDHAIPPATEKFLAARMKAHTVTVKSSHAAMVSQPKAVSALILKAAKAVR
jgi:pimeloyl-ACP methyl ester carboxylesterase